MCRECPQKKSKAPKMHGVSRLQKFENPTAIGTTTYDAAATAPIGGPQRSLAIP
jgi:hypothetical protein